MATVLDTPAPSQATSNIRSLRRRRAAARDKACQKEETIRVPFDVVHSVPGRLRVSASAFRTNSNFSQVFSEELASCAGVTSVRINTWCGTAVVLYKVSEISPDEICTAIERVCTARPSTIHSSAGHQHPAFEESLPSETSFPLGVAHTVSGRLRLRIARLYYDDKFAVGIRGYLLALTGVLSARITRQTASVVVEFDHHQTTSAEIIRTLSTAQPAAILAHGANTQSQDHQVPAKADHSSRLPLYLATAGAVLSLFTAPMVSLWAYPLVALISIPVFQRAWNVVTKQRRLNVDFLDALSVIAAVATGDVRNAALIVWLITLADYIRDLTKARSHRAIDELLEYEKALAWVVRDGHKIQIPATQIIVGDTVVVYTGSRIPVDGTVLSESATVDQQVLTGESLPVLKQEGDKVFAGTTVTEGRIYLHTEKTGANTKAATIVKLVESAPVHETRAQNYAEKVADGLVTPSLIGATAASVAACSISRFAAIVTVDFGTGIRVSAPTSVLSSMAACAKRGILIKGGAYLEKLSQVSVIVFDKTGTLTHGIPEVEEIVRHNGMHKHEALSLAAACATRQTHPVSQAVCRKAESLSLEIPTRESLNFRVGRGLEAMVNGYTVHLGSDRFISELGICSLLPKSHECQFFGQGNSLLYLAVDGIHTATFAYRDKLRQESPEVVSALRHRGISDLVMLTGDSPQIACRVSERLGLTGYHANMLPEDKARIVQEFQSQGKVVAVIGDGINDSPALSYADVGISICSGAEISRELAGVVLMTEDLRKLVEAIDASREAIGLIKQNTAITMGTNALAYFGAALGLLNPVVSTVISNGSAVLACLNGLRPVLRKA